MLLRAPVILGLGLGGFCMDTFISKMRSTRLGPFGQEDPPSASSSEYNEGRPLSRQGSASGFFPDDSQAAARAQNAWDHHEAKAKKQFFQKHESSFRRADTPEPKHYTQEDWDVTEPGHADVLWRHELDVNKKALTKAIGAFLEAARTMEPILEEFRAIEKKYWVKSSGRQGNAGGSEDVAVESDIGKGSNEETKEYMDRHGDPDLARGRKKAVQKDLPKEDAKEQGDAQMRINTRGLDKRSLERRGANMPSTAWSNQHKYLEAARQKAQPRWARLYDPIAAQTLQIWHNLLDMRKSGKWSSAKHGTPASAARKKGNQKDIAAYDQVYERFRWLRTQLGYWNELIMKPLGRQKDGERFYKTSMKAVQALVEEIPTIRAQLPDWSKSLSVPFKGVAPKRGGLFNPFNRGGDDALAVKKQSLWDD